MDVSSTALRDVLHIQPSVHGDSRGYFVELYQAERYRSWGVDATFVQDNASLSRRGTIRGLHLQHPAGQGKLVFVLSGRVWDVAVDVRVGSPTFGQHVACELDAERKNQLYIPAGFAHGFCVLSETALFVYKCTEFYRPEDEITIAYDDPSLGIAWPVDAPTVSKKDRNAPRLRDIDRKRLPTAERPG